MSFINPKEFATLLAEDHADIVAQRKRIAHIEATHGDASFVWTDGYSFIKGYADAEYLHHYWRVDSVPSKIRWYDDGSWDDFMPDEVANIKASYIRKFGAPPPATKI